MSDTAAALRAAFDREFAAAPAPAAEAQADLLRVRIGGEAYVIPLAEVAGCHADQLVVPLPSPAPELLGVASVRGVLVPVYDLRALLAAPTTVAPRWLVIARGTPALAFAFEAVDGHARVPAALGDTVSLGDRLHQVLDVAQLRSQILTRWEPRKP